MKVNASEVSVGDTVENSKRAKRKDIFMRLVDMENALHNKIFSDQTSTFPYRLSRGIRYVMVVLECDTNYIMVEGMRDRTAGEMTQAYKHITKQLNARGIWPWQHILDSKISTEMKECIGKNGSTYQLIHPMTIAAILPKRQSRSLKTTSFQFYVEQTHTSPCICGAGFYHKQSTHSTCSGNQEWSHRYQHMHICMGCMTTMQTPMHH